MGTRTRTVIAIAAAIALIASGQAAAKTFEVTRTNDPAPGNCKPRDCSLREAVLAANARPGPDKIVLPGARRDYKLTIPNLVAGIQEDGSMTGDLDVSNNPLSIVHPGRGKATVRGGAALDDRLITAFDGAPLSISKLKLTGGDAQGNLNVGGAINGQAAVRIRNSAFVENTASGAGGAIDMDQEAPLRIARSSFVRNESTGGTAGVIRSSDGVIMIRTSLFRGNRAASSGGVMRLSGVSPGPVRITRTTLSGNRSGGTGGAIDHDGEESLTITDSTISGNFAAEQGGAIAAGSDAFPLRIVNSTIANNGTNGLGGGISAIGAANVSLNAVTVIRNRAAAADAGKPPASGGGLYHDAAQFAVRNTIVALNTIGVDAVRNDCFDEDIDFDSLGANLLSSEVFCSGFDAPGDLTRANPKLGTLKRNGGPTKTIALKKNSPAIGKAHKPSAPNRDQRGRKRDNNPDIGAYERGA